MSNIAFEGASLGIQSNGQQWISGPNSIILSQGDVIIGDANGKPTRLAIGANGTSLTSNGTTASWQASSGSGTVTNVSSANSDISVAKPTTTPVLTLNSATANTASTIVRRDSSGNFSAGTITAALTGIASGNELPLTFTAPLSRSGNTISLISATIRKVTTSFTFANTDGTVEADTTSGAVTGTLPSASSVSGQEFILSIVAGTNSAIIAAHAGDLIAGQSSWTFNNIGSALSVQSDGTGWAFT